MRVPSLPLVGMVGKPSLAILDDHIKQRIPYLHSHNHRSVYAKQKGVHTVLDDGCSFLLITKFLR